MFKIVLTLSRARVHFLLSPSLAVITENHKLYTWGCGAHGQLGQFSEDTECPPDVLVPTQVKGSYPLCVEGKDFMTVSCGVNHTAAIDRNGKIYTFGNGADGRLGLDSLGSKIEPCEVQHELATKRCVRVACGWAHTVALEEKGKVYTWGSNSFGQLGQGSMDNKPSSTSVVPQQVLRFPAKGVKIMTISCGAWHTMALSEQGAVFSWGGGAYGQLGLGDVLSSLSPALVKFNKSVLAIACGVWHSLALTDEGVVGQTGVVWAFGRGSGGELGLGDFECRFVPTVIKGTLLGERVMRISAGGWNSAALTDKGHVFVWGHNQYSQLAASAPANKPSPEPRKIETLQMMDASGVSCGPAHMAVVTKDGRLYTWGRGDRGQLGHGLVVDKESVPRLVKAGEEDENGSGGSVRLVSRPIQWLLTSPWI